tara:strand:- start:14505 stop:15419 length:915 start_codon:yes stop_codon:yes gene_type:complete
VIKSVSIIIPAFNEEENIVRTISSLLEVPHEGFKFNILVVDNGSTDKTAELAELSGAVVQVSDDKSVAAVRNKGVSVLCGELLIFLDADVSVTKEWHDNIEATLLDVYEDKLLITGSHCSSPVYMKSSLEKYWFDSFESSKSSHLGTGHMIMSRELFERLNGFDASLETGEDYDFCHRAKAIGAQIKENCSLIVVHHDYPKNLVQFVKREAWHGVGDIGSLKLAISSKVFVASLISLAIQLVILVSLLLTWYGSAVIFLCVLVVFLLALSVYKFKKKPALTILINAGYFYFYLIGRFLSLFRMQ